MTDTSAVPKPSSPLRDVWVQFRSHKGAMFGLITLSVLIIAVLIGPYLWVPEKLSVAQAIKLKNQGPSLRFPLGTDQLGRDMLARMLLAGRISLAVGMVSMIIAIVFGTLVGVLAGYFRRLDGPLMRLADLFLALPLIPLLLVLVMLFRDRIAGIIGPEMGAFTLIVFAIGITSWMATARIVRGGLAELLQGAVAKLPPPSTSTCPPPAARLLAGAAVTLSAAFGSALCSA